MKFIDLHSTVRKYVPGLLLLFVLFGYKVHAQYEDQYVSYADFYNGLAPYGQWIQEPQYGYVWAPAVEGDFRPYYTNGKWVMTEYGNLWASEYPWGWATFHYGRWTYDGYYGWLWVPGDTWGPAWVSWRAGDEVFGWAPMPPGNPGETAGASKRCPADWWVFIPQKYIYGDQYYRYWTGPRNNGKNLKNTHALTNTFEHRGVTYITGPAANQVKQATGNEVQIFRVRDSKSRNMRVHNDEVRIFKPAHIKTNIPGSGDDPYPADAMVAPKAIKEPQGVNDAPGEAPFRQEMLAKRNEPHVVPGTGINPTAEPEHRPRTENSLYEWDVNRHVKQDPPPPVTPKPAAKVPAKATTGPKGNPGKAGAKQGTPAAPAREGAKALPERQPVRRGA